MPTIAAVHGLAFGGGAVNGAMIFGLIGAAIGFLVSTSKFVVGQEEATVSEQHKTHSPVTDLDHLHASQPPDNARQLGRSVFSLFEASLNLGGSVWNFEMSILRNFGLLQHFVKRPWLFFLVAFVLLAIAFPAGVVFTLTGIAAIHFQVTAEDGFVARTAAKAE